MQGPTGPSREISEPCHQEGLIKMGGGRPWGWHRTAASHPIRGGTLRSTQAQTKASFPRASAGAASEPRLQLRPGTRGLSQLGGWGREGLPDCGPPRAQSVSLRAHTRAPRRFLAPRVPGGTGLFRPDVPGVSRSLSRAQSPPVQGGSRGLGCGVALTSCRVGGI